VPSASSEALLSARPALSSTMTVMDLQLDRFLVRTDFRTTPANGCRGPCTDGRGYVLADRSCKLSPAGWARQAVDAYHEFKADRLIAERNFGGAPEWAVRICADRRPARAPAGVSHN
jgi:phage terminase large subunit-like protein